MAAGFAASLARHGALPALHAGDRSVTYDELDALVADARRQR